MRKLHISSPEALEFLKIVSSFSLRQQNACPLPDPSHLGHVKLASLQAMGQNLYSLPCLFLHHENDTMHWAERANILNTESFIFHNWIPHKLSEYCALLLQQKARCYVRCKINIHPKLWLTFPFAHWRRVDLGWQMALPSLLCINQLLMNVQVYDLQRQSSVQTHC